MREYFYLDITFSLTGSLGNAQQEPRQKGPRSYFSLTKMVDVGPLFDSLTVSVVGYGCQVWLPETSLFETIYANFNNSTSGNATSAIPEIVTRCQQEDF